MIVQLMLLIVLVPLADLLLLLILAQYSSWWLASGLIVCSAVAGALLARAQWRQLGRRAKEQLAQNQIPSEFVSEAVLIVLTAGLLITPGVVTDVIGLSLLWPRGRRWYRERILGWFRSSLRVSVSGSRRANWPGGSPDEILDADFRPHQDSVRPQPPGLEDDMR